MAAAGGQRWRWVAGICLQVSALAQGRLTSGHYKMTSGLRQVGFDMKEMQLSRGFLRAGSDHAFWKRFRLDRSSRDV